MGIREILIASYNILAQLPKEKLLKALYYLKEEYVELKSQFDILKDENIKLKNELKKEQLELSEKKNAAKNLTDDKPIKLVVNNIKSKKNDSNGNESDKRDNKRTSEDKPNTNGQFELDAQLNDLKEENIKLKDEIEKNKIKAVNKNVNKPSSKKPEWDKKGVGNDGKEKKQPKKPRKGPRKGAGNKPKNLKPNQNVKATVDECSICQKDLNDEKPLTSINSRTIEDIPDTFNEKDIIQIDHEKKYCTDCKEVITAKSDLALPALAQEKTDKKIKIYPTPSD